MLKAICDLTDFDISVLTIIVRNPVADWWMKWTAHWLRRAEQSGVKSLSLWWRVNVWNVSFSLLPTAVSIPQLTSCWFHGIVIPVWGYRSTLDFTSKTSSSFFRGWVGKFLLHCPGWCGLDSHGCCEWRVSVISLLSGGVMTTSW